MNFIRMSREEQKSSYSRRAASSTIKLPLPASSPKILSVHLRQMSIDGSQQSVSSNSSSRLAEGLTLRQPTKSRLHRHTNRLSGVFLRGNSSGSGHIAQTVDFRSPMLGQARIGSMVPGETQLAEDPSELSNQITAPGILKIFGSELCEGAHYKSVLATMHSSAKELVKEALERYGLSKEKAESYVLCDAIGSIEGHQWKTEGFRVVGDSEKPLLLQSLWKPREGLARRFEIQRRSSVEEKRASEKDTVTAGINAQARKLQKSRSRVSSTVIERTSRGQNLWRSRSQVDLLGSDTETAVTHQTHQNHQDHQAHHNHQTHLTHQAHQTHHNHQDHLTHQAHQTHQTHQDQQAHQTHQAHTTHLTHQTHHNHQTHLTHQTHQTHHNHQDHLTHQAHQTHQTHQNHQDQQAHQTHQAHQGTFAVRLHDLGSRREREPSLDQNHRQREALGVGVPCEGSFGPGAHTETLCPGQRGGGHGRREREETESSGDNSQQYSIHPPHHCPYLLLLQGYSHAQEFVMYLITGPSIVIGRASDTGDRSKVSMLLFAPDILPEHCCLLHHSNGSPVVLQPCKGATVTRNGEMLRDEAELRSGDVIGLGRCYLFLFKDPLKPKEVNVSSSPEDNSSAVPWLLSQASSPPSPPRTREPTPCNTGNITTEPQSSRRQPSLNTSTPFLTDPEGHSLSVSYEVDLEDVLVREVVSMASHGAEGRPPLTTAFLLCVCVQHSAGHRHMSDLRRLLLLIAGGVQGAMWEHTKDLAARQPEVRNSKATDKLTPLSLEEMICGLRPLVVWMSNALELLHFIQQQLPLILDWRTRRERGHKDEGEDTEEDNLVVLELSLSCIRSASEETMSALEEVIMLTFQQCVYYVTKVLYPILPGILDCNPFRENTEVESPGHSVRVPCISGPDVPTDIQKVLEVLTQTKRLLVNCQLHPDIFSQLLAYIFYFINASLFNSLMEKGSEAGFYQWSRGVCIRANLDLLLDWAHGSGLGELALEQTRTLSSAVNILATPRENLLQSPWASLRVDYPSLSPAQLHHLLDGYSPASPCPHTWAPSTQERSAALRTADILESFDTHHPLVLPGGGYHLDLSKPVTDTALRKQLDRLQDIISVLSDSTTNEDTYSGKAKGCLGPTAAKRIKMDVLPKASLEELAPSPAEVVLPQAPGPIHSCLHPAASTLPPSSPGSPHHHELDLLSQKLRTLELRTLGAEAVGPRRPAVDPSCLLTPPNTPDSLELAELGKEHHGEHWTRAGGDIQPDQASWSSVINLHEEGGLVSECLAALKGDCMRQECNNMRRILELNEEEEQDNNDEEVFILELQRGEKELGLALVNARDTPLRMNGILVRAVLPNSPAAHCDKLVSGDQILAVNGISLLGLDYCRGKELIQSSGDRPRFLVGRSNWALTKALQGSWWADLTGL